MTAMAGDAGRLSVADYYRIPIVRRRIREYCGGRDGGELTCVFLSGLAAGTDETWDHSPRYPPASLDTLLNDAADISRSTWDSRDLLVHLDMDYQHADRPEEAFDHPADAFLKMERARKALQQLLSEFDLPLLSVMTGRGYHFTGRVPLASPVVARLSALAPVPAWLATAPGRRLPWTTARITEEQARAYTGASLVIEYLSHRTIRASARDSVIPVVVNGTVVGPGAHGRECTSLDFTYAGDPLDIRHMRVAFSAYQTHCARHERDSGADALRLPVIAVPVGSRSLEDMLDRARHPVAAAALAADVSAEIPVVTKGAANLLEAYLASPLAAFHREFYAGEADPPSRWSTTYDRLDLASLLPCVNAPLASPNDLLLKPEHVQHVTRYFLSEGWHPRHIAGLVHSRYAKDFQWADRWTRMDAQTRAEFDVRVFAGMVATGLDEGTDFNCRSAQEKGLCPGSVCTHDLRADRRRLLDRVHP